MSQLTITLDDDVLLTEARQLTGMRSNKALLEYALQLVVALRSIPETLSPKKQQGIQYSKVADILSPSSIDDVDVFPAYEGPPISLEDMDAAVMRMAAQQI